MHGTFGCVEIVCFVNYKLKQLKIYFRLLKGMLLTFKHLRNGAKRRKSFDIANANYFEQTKGTVTIQYPHQQLAVPEVGRYQLDVAIDDCIVCDLCAKICPVDCIEIDAIRATEEFGRTSDGTPRRIYAAKFDIDMAKCMYCGLCTTVCPTECIIMTDTYDKSVADISNLNYSFAEMSAADAENKRQLWEKLQAEKAAAKAEALKGNTP